jgi:hypothetical protein
MIADIQTRDRLCRTLIIIRTELFRTSQKHVALVNRFLCHLNLSCGYSATADSP